MIASIAVCAAYSLASSGADLRATVDQIRRAHGLPSVKLNKSLQEAAESHIRYMVANNTAGHAQEPGSDGFTGRTPGDRARHFGYFGPNSEAVAWSTSKDTDMLVGLFEAPYHRVLFLQPKSPDFGAFSSEGAMCVKFGGDQGDGTVVSPANGNKNVRTAWDGIESPDPLRKTNVKGPVGYPIVLTVFGKDANGFRSVNATLTGPQGAVQVIVLNPASDPYAQNTVIVIPVKPLRSGSTYTATFNYANESGQKTLQTTFSTMR